MRSVEGFLSLVLILRNVVCRRQQKDIFEAQNWSCRYSFLMAISHFVNMYLEFGGYTQRLGHVRYCRLRRWCNSAGAAGAQSRIGLCGTRIAFWFFDHSSLEAGNQTSYFRVYEGTGDSIFSGTTHWNWLWWTGKDIRVWCVPYVIVFKRWRCLIAFHVAWTQGEGGCCANLTRLRLKRPGGYWPHFAKQIGISIPPF